MGTTVLHVHARDDDAEESGNGFVRYAFHDPDVAQPFTIDPVTGILQVSAPLDRELKDFYRLTVTATGLSDLPSSTLTGRDGCWRWGEPGPVDGGPRGDLGDGRERQPAPVRAGRLPRHRPRGCRLQVQPQSPAASRPLTHPGSLSRLKPVIARIRATDADAGENGRVRFSIVSGNIGDRFGIDYEKGDLRYTDHLSRRFAFAPTHEAF